MANLVTVEANSLLAASSAQTTYPAPTGSLKVALVTATGTASAAGTEVVNAGGSTYARQTITFAAASGGSISSNVALTYTNMPGPITVTGVDEYDSAGTPIRRWFGNLQSSKTTNLGDTFTINSGSYTKTLS
jgi:hypothetical protein